MTRNKSFYLPELDGLRFCAFLAVFLYHCGGQLLLHPHDASPLIKLGCAGLRSGCYGVDLFFTLSAYLITELLMRERERTGMIDIAAFYVRRILRIWPLYFAFLGLLALCNGSLPRVFYASSALFVGNFYSAMLDTHAIAAGAAIILWSISVEEQFYLSWPLIARHCDRNRLVAVGIGLWSAALIGREIISAGGIVGLPLWFNTVSHLDSIAGGVLLAAIGIEHLQYRHWLVFGIGLTLWIIAAWNVPMEFGPGFKMMTAFALIAPGSAAMVAGAIGSSGLLRSRPIVYLGRISYGLYIFHSVVIRLCSLTLGKPGWMISPVALCLTIAMAAFSFRYVEAPFLRLKARFQRVRSGDLDKEARKDGDAPATRVVRAAPVASTAARAFK